MKEGVKKEGIKRKRSKEYYRYYLANTWRFIKYSEHFQNASKVF